MTQARENHERGERLAAAIEQTVASEERMRARAQIEKIKAGMYDGEQLRPLRHADTGEILTWY